MGAALSSMTQNTPLEEQARDLGIVRRVAFRFIPFLMACYVVAWLNRVNLSFAALQMNKDLGLTETAYGLGAGLFFVTYCLCEIPSNLLLHKFGASRWIARIMLTWGVLAVATAFIRGPMSFYVMRLLLGAAEAGFYPGVLYFFTLSISVTPYPLSKRPKPDRRQYLHHPCRFCQGNSARPQTPPPYPVQTATVSAAHSPSA
jgi:fucose permease